MGTSLGVLLDEMSLDFISHDAEHVAAMNEAGALIEGAVTRCVKVRAKLPSQMEGQYDIVIFAVKQRETRAAASFVRPFLKEDGALVTVQNGLPEALIAEIIGADNTYGCAVAWGATFLGEGKSELTSSPEALTFSLGAYGKADGRLGEIKAYLECMGPVTVEENFIGARWSKLLINAAFSGISTFTGLTFGEIAKHKTGKRVALEVIQECIRVAAAANIKIEPIQGHDIEKLLGYRGAVKKAIALFILPIAMKKHAALISSMLQSLRQGKKCEIDYIDGVVCDFGRKYGVETPVCDKICTLVHEIEDGKRQIATDNLREFSALIG